MKHYNYTVSPPCLGKRINVIIASLSVLAVLAGVIGANATSHGNTKIFDETYGNVGKWRILHGRDEGDTCVAEQDNANVTLRFEHTNYTDDWYIGVPYYKDDSPLGGISTDAWDDGVQFETSQANGWAYYHFQGQILRDFKRGSHVTIELDRGRQTWSLSGSAKALAMVQECARNAGKRPARQQVARQRPAQNQVQNFQRPAQQQVNRKAVLSGTWVWSNPQKNATESNIVSTIEMTGSNTARYCYGFPCWDVQVNVQPDNSVSFTIDGVSHFEFIETGVNSISGRYWANFNNHGAPDATVNMR